MGAWCQQFGVAFAVLSGATAAAAAAEGLPRGCVVAPVVLSTKAPEWSLKEMVATGDPVAYLIDRLEAYDARDRELDAHLSEAQRQTAELDRLTITVAQVLEEDIRQLELLRRDLNNAKITDARYKLEISKVERDLVTVREALVVIEAQQGQLDEGGDRKGTRAPLSDTVKSRIRSLETLVSSIQGPKE